MQTSKKDLGKQLYFTQVKPEKFRKLLKAHYYGQEPFSKSQSYAAFVSRQNEKHYLGKAVFSEIIFTYKFLKAAAGVLHIKPSENDKATALRMFFGIQKEAESVKCKHCCGHGYVKKTIAYGSEAFQS